MREFSSNMNGTVVEFLGMEKGNGTALSKEYNVSDVETDPVSIPELLIWSHLSAYSRKLSSVKISLSLYETLRITGSPAVWEHNCP